MENQGSAAGLMILVVWLAVVIFLVAAMWKVYVKAGKPGWAVLVPFYNIYVLLEIVGRPGWWLVLMLIPIVNIIIAIITTVDLAKRFSKGAGFAAGLIFLPFICYPMLGFGDSKYTAS